MDVTKVKQKLEQFKNNSSRGGNVWKAPNGKTQIRLVDYKFDKDVPFVELYFHFNIIKNKPILSPISYGELDPIVEFAKKLKKTGSKEDEILAKKLEPRIRIFAPIVVRGSENEGVKIWGFGSTVSNELKSFIDDPDYGNIADPINGRDIVVESLSKEEAGNGFGKTNVRMKPNKTALHTDASMVEKFLENQPNINELFTKYSYDELKEVLKNFLEPKANAATEAEKKEPSATESVSASKGKSAQVQNVETAFDDMFNN